MREAPRNAGDQLPLVVAARVETMEPRACNVIYIDRRANDEQVRRESLSDSLSARTSTGSVSQGYFGVGKAPPAEIHTNVETILSTFNQGMACSFFRSV